MAIMHGKVGIGTISPDKLLHLGDDYYNINGEIRFEASDGDIVDLGITTDDEFYITGGNVGIGTTNPQAALDVVSTTGGFIVPRMTNTQQSSITAVNGMIIYDTTNNQFEFFEAGSWVTGQGLK
jgi:hypothetical protein